MSTTPVEDAEIPAHIPRELVRDFDLYNLPGLESGRTRDLHAVLKAIQDSHPRLFWTPRYGGHWVATRYAEIERMLQDAQLFSATEPYIPRHTVPRQLPQQLDPPEHGPFRKLLMPAFTPPVLARASDRARETAIAILERLQPQGRCEFVADFAGVMPIIAFLTLIDLPADDYAYLRGLAVFMTKATHPQSPAAWAEMSEYVHRQIAMRREDPRDDFITRLINGKVGDRQLSPEEAFSMVLIVIGGGLDTVVSMTSFAATFLAQNPAHRHQLIEQPDLIGGAVEEICRRFGTSNLGRMVRSDTALGDVPLREGDMIVGMFPLAGLDEEVNPDPLAVDWSRRQRRYLNFGTGAHTCIGMPLAKREIRIFLEEWLSRIPDFRLPSGYVPSVTTGIVNSPGELELVWDPL